MQYNAGAGIRGNGDVRPKISKYTANTRPKKSDACSSSGQDVATDCIDERLSAGTQRCCIETLDLVRIRRLVNHYGVNGKRSRSFYEKHFVVLK
jgi:hypothetical protein